MHRRSGSSYSQIESFDLFSYFAKHGVHYSSSGDNTTEGWVNVQCLFCPDHKNHLGINVRSKLIHCWLCGARGSIVRYIMALEGIPYNQAVYVVQKFQDQTLSFLKQDILIRHTGKDPFAQVLPEDCSDDFPPTHLEYLRRRRFPPEVIIPQYGLKACGNLGPYKHRIIVPFSLGGSVVNFTAIDVTGEAEARYKHCPNDRAIVPAKECLYNVDTVRDTVLVVEGVTDVWRMGRGAVAVLGIEYTTKQIERLVATGAKKAIVMFDYEAHAIRSATRLAKALSPFMKTEVWELPEGDPADLPDEEAGKIRREIFGI